MDFLPVALEDGSFVAAPDLEVWGRGCSLIIRGLRLIRRG
jgi:hypothetical protein